MLAELEMIVENRPLTGSEIAILAVSAAVIVAAFAIARRFFRRSD
jgi:hypothetical protein